MFTFRRLTITVFFLSLVLLTGCMGANEEFIQGEWHFSEPHLRNLPAESHLTTVWTFDGGYFYNYTCCFNTDTELRGNYRIESDEGNVLTLELYNVDGWSSQATGQLRVEVNAVDDTIQVYGSGPYTRMTPKYTSDK